MIYIYIYRAFSHVFDFLVERMQINVNCTCEFDVCLSLHHSISVEKNTN